MREKFDFAGWATRNDILCADGRTIRDGAFRENDGQTVPLVYQHQHNDPKNVLGHALLEYRPGEGMYCYAKCNNTENGQLVKEAVAHGDLTSFSIYANNLTQHGGDVVHGRIREVSVVLAGANDGAVIEYPVLTHSGETVYDEAIIYASPSGLTLSHADDSEEDDELDADAFAEIFDNLTDEQKKAAFFMYMIADAQQNDVSHSDLDDNDPDVEKLSAVFNSLTDEQKNAAFFMFLLANDQDNMSHSDTEEEEEIRMDESRNRGDLSAEEMANIFEGLSDEEQQAAFFMFMLAQEDDEIAHDGLDCDIICHADVDPDEMAAIFESLSNEEQQAAYFMFMLAQEEDTTGELSHSALFSRDYGDYNYYEEEDALIHNVFDYDGAVYGGNVLTHADEAEILDKASRNKVGSLREMLESDELMHSIDTTGMDTAVGQQTYGFNDAGMLFPDYRALNVPPEFIQRDQSWVKVVMSGVKHSMFSRIKSLYANITEDEARAKGYVKGNQKKNEVFATLKRTTDPQTIYKHQKMDRDDIVDITDFDVVAWLKSEMREMLDEEIARAILIGDGREDSDEAKIQENHVRPIANDVPLFNTKVTVTTPNGTPPSDKAKKAIDDIIRARKHYKGSGNPTFFTTEDWLTEMLLVEDDIGHKLYKTVAELATTLRVKEIVTVEPMEGYTIAYGSGGAKKDLPLIGVIVNLNDYNVGADKGGAVNMFDDFDIDYNQYKYLIETRISGALVKPYSALTILDNEASS